MFAGREGSSTYLFAIRTFENKGLRGEAEEEEEEPAEVELWGEATAAEGKRVSRSVRLHSV
jgi:hypothetical protein